MWMRRAGATHLGTVWGWERDCARGEDGNILVKAFIDGELFLANRHLFYKCSTSPYFCMEMGSKH